MTDNSAYIFHYTSHIYSIVMENQGLYEKNVFDVSEKCLVCNIKREILGQKIKVKTNN